MATPNSSSDTRSPCPCTAHWPGPAPGKARVTQEGSTLSLENDVLRITWIQSSDALTPHQFSNRLTGECLSLADQDLFWVLLDNAPSPQPARRAASEMTLAGKPSVRQEPGRSEATRAAQREACQVVEAEFRDGDSRMRVFWRAELRDGANSVRVSCRLVPQDWIAVAEVGMLRGTGDDLTAAGEFDGVPVTGDSWFCGVEHPRSLNQVQDDDGDLGVTCRLPFIGLVRSPAAVTVSAVLGVAPQGQMRRAFLYYLEREGPQPYAPYVHYNNGYEIGVPYWNRLREDPEAGKAFRLEEDALYCDLVDELGTELVSKRGMVLDGVVHDFMWDDEHEVWRFHEGYPEGFANVADSARTYGAGVGVWFGPWGGYAGRKARVEGGRNQGFLITGNGLTLTCPNYRGRLLSAACGMLQQQGAGYFKLDGFALGNNRTGAGEYASEADALIEVIETLRDLKPDIVVNPSTGSWPSPFWLLHADVIWRQGSDSGVIQAGSPRQKWITYRDAQTYQHVVKASPLFPLNALMLHGLYMNCSRFAGNPNDPEGNVQNFDLEDVAAEARTFFGSGTLLQELYVDPRLMTDDLWDVIADAAKWARHHAEVLVDTHWIGGDPAELQVYGWAAWSPHKGILVVRNPGENKQTHECTLARAFDLPDKVPHAYTLDDVWSTRPEFQNRRVTAAETISLTLDPFEVLVLEARPEDE